MYRIKRNGAYELVHSFQGPDGRGPNSAVVLDKSGNIYGATRQGGTMDFGALYKLAPDGIATVLYSFTSVADGQNPNGNLAQDSFGNLYGTTRFGGEDECGTLFRLKGGKTKTILHSFRCDAANRAEGVIRNKAGDLFGVASQSGQFGWGVVYQYSNGLLHILHDFDPCCGDGTFPNGALSLDNNYVYGVTRFGGANDMGTVFRVALSDGAVTVLHSFAGGDDGNGPVGGVTGRGKYLYGTTQFGGGDPNAGTIFRVRK